ncbi:MAG: hypothetical protein KBE23_03090 [Chloroflexi bacterium]|nr:hypothetical protein [Chloroflexota bacterium]MBP7041698.1 hypothetical protein [Chloroflexota bacterium]
MIDPEQLVKLIEQYGIKYAVIAIVASVLLAGLISGVSALFNHRMRVAADKQLEHVRSELKSTEQKLQAALDSRISISRTQYDKEFEIYLELWSLLVDLRRAVLGLRPTVDSYDPEESEDERKKKRFEAFKESFYKFKDAVEKNKPFYSIEVFAVIDEFLDTVYSEGWDYIESEKRDRDYWKAALENRKIISQQVDNACEAIRHRMNSISIATE